jgi:hypothetical protein
MLFDQAPYPEDRPVPFFVEQGKRSNYIMSSMFFPGQSRIKESNKEATMRAEVNRTEFLRISAQTAAIAGLVGDAGRPFDVFASESPVKVGDAASITSLIKDYVAKTPTNSIRNTENERAWNEPLVGFSSGDDPIYQFYKEDIGPFYWTPIEIFKLSFPEIAATSEDLSIISWVLPHTESIKADLRKQTKTPSEKWIRARTYGGDFIDELSRYVADMLTKSGYPSVAPSVSKSYNQIAPMAENTVWRPNGLNGTPRMLPDLALSDCATV